MNQNKSIIPPPVVWAQRSGQVFLTFCLEACKNPIVKIEPEKIYFKGVGGTERKEHEVTINFYKEVDPENAVHNSKGRLYEVIIPKKVVGPFWPRLTQEKQKYHWLKCDFNKWKDEDESDSEAERVIELDKPFKDYGFFNDKAESKPYFEESDDSDDEHIPDLE